ncbi:MAG: hypothetical protein NVSMB29_18810 [Candidatus Dormibacteria bacterium]
MSAMPRRPAQKIKLPARPAPVEMRAVTALCPACEAREVPTVGRLGLRLLFECPKCGARFHRADQAAA